MLCAIKKLTVDESESTFLSQKSRTLPRLVSTWEDELTKERVAAEEEVEAEVVTVIVMMIEVTAAAEVVTVIVMMIEVTAAAEVVTVIVMMIEVTTAAEVAGMTIEVTAEVEVVTGTAEIAADHLLHATVLNAVVMVI